MAGDSPVSFTVIAERLLLTPWDEATLTLPEMDAVAAWGGESRSRAIPGTAQTKVASKKVPETIHRPSFALLCIVFNNALPDLGLAIPRCSRVRWNFPAVGTSLRPARLSACRLSPGWPHES